MELALKQIRKGNRPTTGFNEVGYEAIIDDFRKRMEIKYEKLKFKNLSNTMRNAQHEWKKLTKATRMVVSKYGHDDFIVIDNDDKDDIDDLDEDVPSQSQQKMGEFRNAITRTIERPLESEHP